MKTKSHNSKFRLYYIKSQVEVRTISKELGLGSKCCACLMCTTFLYNIWMYTGMHLVLSLEWGIHGLSMNNRKLLHDVYLLLHLRNYICMVQLNLNLTSKHVWNASLKKVCHVTHKCHTGAGSKALQICWATIEFLAEFLMPLTSFMQNFSCYLWVSCEWYHNLTLDTHKWCTCEVHHLKPMY